MKPPTVKRRPLRTSQPLTYDDHGASDVYGSAMLAALQHEQQSNAGTRRSPGSVRRRDRGDNGRIAENCRVYGIRCPSSSSRGAAAGAKRGRGGGAREVGGRVKPVGDSSRSKSRQSQFSVVATATPTTTDGADAEVGSTHSIAETSATGRYWYDEGGKISDGRIGWRGDQTETASHQLHGCVLRPTTARCINKRL